MTNIIGAIKDIDIVIKRLEFEIDRLKLIKENLENGDKEKCVLETCRICHKKIKDSECMIWDMHGYSHPKCNKR